MNPDRLIDRLFYWVFFGIFFLVGKLLRLIFDLLVYGTVRGYHAWKAAHPREIEGFPLEARFEHTHIVAGSGHGKTQLMQTLILKDLWQLKEGHGSVCSGPQF